MAQYFNRFAQPEETDGHWVLSSYINNIVLNCCRAEVMGTGGSPAVLFSWQDCAAAGMGDIYNIVLGCYSIAGQYIYRHRPR